MVRVGPRVALPATIVPALLTTIAYVDPGNFGTNIAAGTRHGFALAWVVVLAAASAAVIQYLAAKLGLATGAGLAEHCAERLPRGPRLLAWAQAELVVIMTDLAEIVGGALGLQLLTGLPLEIGAVVVGLVTFVALGLGHGGYRPIALGLLAVVAATVALCAVQLGPAWDGLPPGLVPASLDENGLVLAAGIVGATVMPHALYFHSAVSGLDDRESRRSTTPQDVPQVRRRVIRSIVISMTVVGIVNVLILVVGTALPGAQGTIADAYTTLVAGGQDVAATLLGIALIASGFASAIVGAWTGQSVMQGFLRVDLSAWKRRLVAVLPPVLLLAAGVDPDRALVYSQVVLGLALPLTLLPLVLLTGHRATMGALRNSLPLTVVAWTITAAITVLDVALLVGAVT